MVTTVLSNKNVNFTDIDSSISELWSNIFSSSPLVKTINSGNVTKSLYAIYMIETYHYTSHNAANQALAGVKNCENPVYAKFCFKHACDETGHEQMALHDLLSLGVKEDEFVLPKPLPETEMLIAYLYWISSNGSPFRRLGYSYWAEGSYKYINPLIHKVKDSLKLDNSQMTFFIAHSDIDKKHAEEVESIILRTCKEACDWDDMKTVAETSLRLTAIMLDAIYREHQNFVNGKSKRYEFLNRCFT
jgi:pyrroloquinoline quinone (PQQ) biosynthesis protein C